MITDWADPITGTTAHLVGHISNDNGGATGARFVWGDAASYGSSCGWSADSYYAGQYFSCDAASLTKGKTYHFRIEGHNCVGYGGNGSDAVFTTKPDAPSGFSAATVSSSQINLSWSQGSGAYNTMIRRRTDTYPTSPSDGTYVYYGTGTSYSNTGLSSGTTYYYSAWSDAYEEGYYKYSDTYVQASATTKSDTQITDFGFDPSVIVLGQQTAVRGYLKTTGGTGISGETLTLMYYGADTLWHSTGQSGATGTGGYMGFYWTPSSFYQGTVSYRLEFAGRGNYNASQGGSANLTVNPKSATVTAPNGGEVWQAGNTYNITWNCGGLSQVWIALDNDTNKGNGNVRSVASGLSANCPSSGSYNWTVPTDIAAGSYYIMVADDDSGVDTWDFSNSIFTVKIPTKIDCYYNKIGSDKGCIFESDSCQVGEGIGIGGRLLKSFSTDDGIDGKMLELWQGGTKVTDIGTTYTNYGHAGWAHSIFNPTNAYLGTKTYQIRFAGDSQYVEGWSSSYVLTVDPAAQCLVPASLSCAGITDNSITLSWNAVAGATKYKIKYIDESGDWGSPSYVSVTGTSKTFTGLPGGTKYYFMIQVETSDGTCTAPGNWSDLPVRCVTTGDSCAWPTSPVCDNLSLGGGKYNVTVCPYGWDYYDNDCCQYDNYVTGTGYRQYDFDDCTTGCDCDMDLRVKNIYTDSNPADTSFKVTLQVLAKGASHNIRAGFTFDAGGNKFSYVASAVTGGLVENCRTEKLNLIAVVMEVGQQGEVDITLNCGDGAVNCGETCDWGLDSNCNDTCTGLKDTTPPTSKILSITRNSDGANVTNDTIWLKAGTYTMTVEDKDNTGGVDLKDDPNGCFYYIWSWDSSTSSWGVPTVDNRSRNCNQSIQFTVGPTGDCKTQEFRPGCSIYIKSIDKNNLSSTNPEAWRSRGIDYTLPSAH